LSAEEYNPKPQGYSKTKRAVVKVGKCIGPLYDTLSQYDRINTVPATAGQHHLESLHFPKAMVAVRIQSGEVKEV